jgi:uridine phosphorylase
MENKETMYHIGLSKKDIKGAKYAILPGDPGRVSSIAKHLKKKELLKVQREYTSYLGELAGEKVLVISTGMGGPSAAICVEELSQIGVENLIRVGTCGGMQLDVSAGDIIVAQAAIRQEGTSKEYVPVEFPAVADFDLTYALKKAAEELKYPHHVGVVQCKDSFYGQHSPHRMPVSYELENKWNAWIKAGALASEMETASVFTVARVLRMKAAAVLLTVWNQEKEKIGLPQETSFDTECAIKVAIRAIENEIMRSKKNGQNKK